MLFSGIVVCSLLLVCGGVDAQSAPLRQPRWATNSSGFGFLGCKGPSATFIATETVQHPQFFFNTELFLVSTTNHAKFVANITQIPYYYIVSGACHAFNNGNILTVPVSAPDGSGAAISVSTRRGNVGFNFYTNEIDDTAMHSAYLHGDIYLGDVLASNVTTGQFIWKWPVWVPPDAFYGGVCAPSTVAKDVAMTFLTVSSTSGCVAMGINVSTGITVWNGQDRKLPLPTGVYLPGDGVYYYQTGSQSIGAIDVASGSFLWNFTFSEPLQVVQTVMGDGHGAIFLTVNGVGAVTLAALTPTGSIKWNVALTNWSTEDVTPFGVIQAAGATRHGQPRVYLCQQGAERVWAYDRETGRAVWVSEAYMCNVQAGQPLTFSDSTLVAATAETTFAAFDA